MHDTSLLTGSLFLQWALGEIGVPAGACHVLDIGGLDVNGSLRSAAVNLGMNYASVDLEEHESVDIVISPYESLPFPDHSVHVIVSTSCFEHDPCFWITFREMCRVLHPRGYIYVSAPSNGPYHSYPADSWRFYTDAAQALAVWASRSFYGSPAYPIKVQEVFHVLPSPEENLWIDFVAVWSFSDHPTTDIATSRSLITAPGPFQQLCKANGLRTCQQSLLAYPYLREAGAHNAPSAPNAHANDEHSTSSSVGTQTSD